VAANVNRNQGEINFGNQNIGSTSSVSVLTITNHGNATLSFQSPAYSLTGNAGDFSVQPGAINGCDFVTVNSLSAGNSCTLSVTLTPTVAGNRAAMLTLNDNAANITPQIVNLSGTGVVP
jgi:hypothetical protein